MHAATPAKSVPAKRLGAFAALRHRNFRLFWIGYLIAVFGQNIELVAQGWLMYDLTNSPLFLGLAGASNAVPQIALSFFGGALADRVDRRRLLLVTQSILMSISLALALLVLVGLAEPWHVMVAAFLSGTVRAFDGPARQAIFPHLVARQDMLNAVALNSVHWQFGRIAGPPVAGVAIAALGVGACFLFTAFGYAVMSCTIYLLRVPSLTGTPGGILQAIREGVLFIARQPIFRSLMGMTFFNSVFGLSYSYMLPIFARDLLEVGPGGYGLLQGASGLGALAGTAYLSLGGPLGRKGTTLLTGGALFGSLLILFAWSPWFPLSLALLCLAGLANMLYQTLTNTVVQLQVPDQLRGRVMGIFQLTWSLLPLGGMVQGGVASFAGAPIAVTVGGALVLGLAVVLAVTAPFLRRLV